MNVTDFRRFEYQGTVVRVVDGDTFVVRADLGFDPIETTKQIRVLFANAPEKHGATRVAGLAAEAWLTDRLMGKKVLFLTRKDEQSFVRWLAEVWYDPDAKGELRNLADDMIAAGVAIRTDEHGKAITS